MCCDWEKDVSAPASFPERPWEQGWACILRKVVPFFLSREQRELQQSYTVQIFFWQNSPFIKFNWNRGGEPRKFQLHENAMAQVARNTVSVNQHEPMPSANHDSSNQPSYTEQNKIVMQHQKTPQQYRPASRPHWMLTNAKSTPSIKNTSSSLLTNLTPFKIYDLEPWYAFASQISILVWH
mgnify:CR=1 FL=1